MNRIDLKKLAGYEEDFALWCAEQAALLRAGKFDRVDVENVAEEVESLGRSDKHQIRSRLEVLLMHLLKWERQRSTALAAGHPPSAINAARYSDCWTTVPA